MGRKSLGEFELIVLLAAMQLGSDEAHTLAIVDEIGRRTERKVKRTAVYVTLQRLENKGFVTSWLSEPRPERGGKGRRHIRLLEAGEKAVAETRSALENMWLGLEATGTSGAVNLNSSKNVLFFMQPSIVDGRELLLDEVLR